MLLLLLALLNFQDYVVSTWGPWLIAITLLIAPFWFNPQTFSLSKTTVSVLRQCQTVIVCSPSSHYIAQHVLP